MVNQSFTAPPPPLLFSEWLLRSRCREKEKEISSFLRAFWRRRTGRSAHVKIPEGHSLLFSLFQPLAVPNRLFTLSVYHQRLSHVRGDKCERGHFKAAASASDYGCVLMSCVSVCLPFFMSPRGRVCHFYGGLVMTECEGNEQKIEFIWT